MSNTNKHYIEEEYATEQSRFFKRDIGFIFLYIFLVKHLADHYRLFNFWVSSCIHSTSSVGFLFSYFNEH